MASERRGGADSIPAPRAARPARAAPARADPDPRRGRAAFGSGSACGGSQAGRRCRRRSLLVDVDGSHLLRLAGSEEFPERLDAAPALGRSFVPVYWNEWRQDEVSEPQLTIDRLLRAINDHDLEASAACFAEDYENETPAHPARGFRGKAQVRRNWGQIFAFVPDLRAEVTRSAVAGEVTWTEWEMTGTPSRRDSALHAGRGHLRCRRRRRAVGTVLPRARRRQRHDR